MDLRLAIFRAAALTAALPILLLVGCRSGTPPETAGIAISSSDPGAAQRGEYLFNAANCVGCHTDREHGGARLAGGRAVETPFGAYISRNITPDPTNGIGAWSDGDFLGALRRGISPAGAHYFPAFPFPAFTGMTDRDILDIKAYLFTQKPEPQPNQPHRVGFPFDIRLNMVFWRALYFTEGPLPPDPAQSPEWIRGAYLANAVAHCGECHTPRTSLGGIENDRRFAGAKLAGPNGKEVPNITSDLKAGIGTWSLDDVMTVLTNGHKPDGDSVGAPMSEVVEGTGKLSAADRRAIAVYVKSVPPIGKGG